MKKIIFEKSTGDILIHIKSDINEDNTLREVESLFHEDVIGLNERYKSIDVTSLNIEDQPNVITNIKNISPQIYPVLAGELWSRYMNYQNKIIDVNFLSLITEAKTLINAGHNLPENKKVVDWINDLWSNYYIAKRKLFNENIYDDNIDIANLNTTYQNCFIELNP